MKDNKEYKGTKSPLYNFFGTLTFGFIPVFISIVCIIIRFFDVMFMSRKRQYKNKWAYIKGEFNMYYYIAGKN